MTHLPDFRIEPPAPDYVRARRAYRLPLGERLVLFFRLNGEAISFWFAMASIALLVGVVVGAYVGAAR